MKTIRLFTIGIALCCAAATSLFGQTTNFYCTNAVQMISGTNYSQNISGVPSNSDPALGCGVSIGCGVWYTVTPGINQRVNINTAGSTFPTYLAIYTGTCGALTNILCNGGNGYYGNNGLASANFSSVSNTTYHILVGSYSGAGSGTPVVFGRLSARRIFSGPSHIAGSVSFFCGCRHLSVTRP